jgi:hypothetical protein
MDVNPGEAALRMAADQAILNLLKSSQSYLNRAPNPPLLKALCATPQARRFILPSAPPASSPFRALLQRCRRHLSFSNLAQDADDLCRIEADINTFHIER